MKFSLFLHITAIAFFLSNCNVKTEGDTERTREIYMDMTATSIPSLLAPGILATSLSEYNGTFSPDGKTFYFTTNAPGKGIISYTELGIDNVWTTPRAAFFSGTYSEYDPMFSPDGSKLYFSSERPVKGLKDINNPTNIWYVEKNGSKWSQPTYVELDEGGNYYNSITDKGDVYFNRWKNGDMYKRIQKADTFEIVKLPLPINSESDEGDPFISPKEDYIIFRAYENSLGRGDLFISFNIGGSWTVPENLGAPINSPAHEMCPYVTIDGKFFIFSSSRVKDDYAIEGNEPLSMIRSKHSSADNGEQNIYYVSADFIHKRKQKYL